MSEFDVEEFDIDIYYWFDKSTNRKGEYDQFCEFCDAPYRKVLKHLAVRWLSLELTIERILKQFQPLKLYFTTSTTKKNYKIPRFVRLNKLFSDPLLELHLMFFQSTFPTSTNFNKFFQYEHPIVHCFYPTLKFLRNLLSEFIQTSFVEHCTNETEFNDFENYILSDKDIFIGFATKQKLRSLERD